MGRYVSAGLDVDDARSYVEYAGRLAAAVPPLVADGRIPETEALHDFLELFDRVLTDLGRQADTAALTGESEFTAELRLTEQELRMYSDMGGSLGSLLEILGMRGAHDLTAPDSATRFAEALGGGTFEP